MAEPCLSMSDLVFGWRQLRKHPSASAAAVLSLALAIGAATAASRLVDAVLLRTLPVAEPVGLACGLMSARFIEALLYEVKVTDTGMVIAPSRRWRLPRFLREFRRRCEPCASIRRTL